jgi:[ribosomal protein S5]-alanine N-acetyltransferase
MKLETPRLHLRLLTAADAGFILQLVNEPAWLRFIGDRNVHDRAGAEAYIGRCLRMHEQHGVCSLGVEQRTTAEVIGICGLLQREHLRDLDLGFAFLERFRGQGFAREAASAVLEFGHRNLRRERILALTNPENTASIALLTKLGFRPESSVKRPDGTIETQIFVHTLAG